MTFSLNGIKSLSNKQKITIKQSYKESYEENKNLRVLIFDLN